jgi:hypothetical protein
MMSKLYIIPDWAGVRTAKMSNFILFRIVAGVRTAKMSKIYIIPDCGRCEDGTRPAKRCPDGSTKQRGAACAVG